MRGTIDDGVDGTILQARVSAPAWRLVVEGVFVLFMLEMIRYGYLVEGLKAFIFFSVLLMIGLVEPVRRHKRYIPRAARLLKEVMLSPEEV